MRYAKGSQLQPPSETYLSETPAEPLATATDVDHVLRQRCATANMQHSERGRFSSLCGRVTSHRREWMETKAPGRNGSDTLGRGAAVHYQRSLCPVALSKKRTRSAAKPVAILSPARTCRAPRSSIATGSPEPVPS